MTISTSSLGTPQIVDLPEGPVRVWVNGDKRDTGEDIVLVHGIVANADVWREVSPRLATAHRVFTLDLPLGAHAHPMSPATDFTLFGLAAMVDRILKALQLDRVTLIGNDTGGAIATTVAARHPGSLSRLVLTPCDAFDNFLPWWIRHLQVLGRTPKGLYILAHALRWRVVQRLPIAFGRLTVRPIPSEIMTSYTSPLRRDRAVREDFARLVRAISSRYTQQAAAGLVGFNRPGLVLWGGETGRFFPLAQAQRLAGLLPDGRLVVVPDGGCFLAEDRPAELVDHVMAFIQDTPDRATRPVRP